MAKIASQKWIRCTDCKHSIGNAVNYLIGCSHKEANPSGCMMGTYQRMCDYFKQK